MLEIEIRNKDCKIMTPLNQNWLSLISDMMSFKVEGSEFKQNILRHWDGHKRLFNKQTKVFPIGMLDMMIDTLKKFGVEYSLIDKRIFHNPSLQLNMNDYEVRKYQTDAVYKSIIYGHGIIKAATGSGKTTIACKTIYAMAKPTIFIVHTKDLLYQTKSAFERMLGTTIGQIGDGIIDLQPITVATVQTLSLAADFEYSKYKYDEESGESEKEISITDQNKIDILKWSKSIHVVMFDEVQRVCSRTAYSARFMFENAHHAFGYSASPWRDDGSDLMIEAAFGRRIVDITASELILQGFLVRPIIMIKSGANNPNMYGKYEQVYKDGIVENQTRNLKVANDAINSYKSGKCTMILVTQLKHGELLQDIISEMGSEAIFISGKSKMKHRKQVIENMRHGKTPIVIATTIADVGLDVPRIHTVIEAGSGKSSVTALQRVGRCMRRFAGKNECHYITYRDNIPYINQHIENKIKIWKTESEYIIQEE